MAGRVLAPPTPEIAESQLGSMQSLAGTYAADLQSFPPVVIPGRPTPSTGDSSALGPTPRGSASPVQELSGGGGWAPNHGVVSRRSSDGVIAPVLPAVQEDEDDGSMDMDFTNLPERESQRMDESPVGLGVSSMDMDVDITTAAVPPPKPSFDLGGGGGEHSQSKSASMPTSSAQIRSNLLVVAAGPAAVPPASSGSTSSDGGPDEESLQAARHRPKLALTDISAMESQPPPRGTRAAEIAVRQANARDLAPMSEETDELRSDPIEADDTTLSATDLLADLRQAPQSTLAPRPAAAGPSSDVDELHEDEQEEETASNGLGLPALSRQPSRALLSPDKSDGALSSSPHKPAPLTAQLSRRDLFSAPPPSEAQLKLERRAKRAARAAKKLRRKTTQIGFDSDSAPKEDDADDDDDDASDTDVEHEAPPVQQPLIEPTRAPVSTASTALSGTQAVPGIVDAESQDEPLIAAIQPPPFATVAPEDEDEGTLEVVDKPVAAVVEATVAPAPVSEPAPPAESIDHLRGYAAQQREAAQPSPQRALRRESTLASNATSNSSNRALRRERITLTAEALAVVTSASNSFVQPALPPVVAPAPVTSAHLQPPPTRPAPRQSSGVMSTIADSTANDMSMIAPDTPHASSSSAEKQRQPDSSPPIPLASRIAKRPGVPPQQMYGKAKAVKRDPTPQPEPVFEDDAPVVEKDVAMRDGSSSLSEQEEDDDEDDEEDEDDESVVPIPRKKSVAPSKAAKGKGKAVELPPRASGSRPLSGRSAAARARKVVARAVEMDEEPSQNMLVLRSPPKPSPASSLNSKRGGGGKGTGKARARSVIVDVGPPIEAEPASDHSRPPSRTAARKGRRGVAASVEADEQPSDVSDADNKPVAKPGKRRQSETSNAASTRPLKRAKTANPPTARKSREPSLQPPSRHDDSAMMDIDGEEDEAGDDDEGEAGTSTRVSLVPGAPFDRVWAYYRQARYFYPATIVEARETDVLVRYDADGPMTKPTCVPYADIRRLVLQPGDEVEDSLSTADEPGLVRVAVVEVAETGAERTGCAEMDDIVVVVPDDAEEEDAQERIELAQLAIPLAECAQLDDRRCTAEQIRRFRAAGLTSAGARPRAASLPPVVPAHFALAVPAAPAVRTNGGRPFDGIGFMTTKPGKKTASPSKKTALGVEKALERGGALLIEQPDQLFGAADDDTAESYSAVEPAYTDDPRLTRLHTIVLLASEPAPSPKYLYALALGVPCVHVRWAVDSLEHGAPLDWRPYALGSPAAPSLGGASVLGLQSSVISAPDRRFGVADLQSRRAQFALLDGQYVLDVYKGPKGARPDRRELIRNLTTALGAANVRPTNVSGLGSVGADVVDLVLLDDGVDKTDLPVPLRAKAVNLEWLKDSLFTGLTPLRLLPPAK